MKDKDGNEIVEENNQNQLSQEDLIAKTVAGVLDGMKENNADDPPANEVDPFDFSTIDQDVNNQNIDHDKDQNNNNDQNNQNNNDQNNQNNQNNQPIHDSRVDALLVNVDANTRDVETNRRTTSMNNFILDLNNEIKGVPELEIHRNEAIIEAKKSIASGGYIPAGDMLSYLHGKDNIGKLKNVEKNNNPHIGGETKLNPSGDDKPFDLNAATADEIQEKYKDVAF